MNLLHNLSNPKISAKKMLMHAMLMNQSIIACLSLNRLLGGNTVQNDEFLSGGMPIMISPTTCSSWIARKFRH